MPRIVLVSTQVAPFQAELAQAVNALPDTSYRVVFTRPENSRPPHWLDLDATIAGVSEILPGDLPDAQHLDWTIARIAAQKPDVLLVGGVRNLPARAALAYRARHDRDVALGMWMEQPLLSPSALRRAVRRLDYLWRLRRVDFVLAIGDRAEAYYAGCNANTHFVPYGSDLSHCLAQELPKPRAPRMRFLFSGGLHPRHNFPLVMAGFEALLAARGPCFEFVISGDGPEQATIDAAVARVPELGPLIRYDRTFERWVDRLRPFLEADVFIYPTRHAGWGLVVPEAMAAGLPVIASHGAEAARHLVQDGVSGLMIPQTAEAFGAALIRCVDDPEAVTRMGLAAREAARRCDAPAVARRLCDALVAAGAVAPWLGR